MNEWRKLMRRDVATEFATFRAPRGRRASTPRACQHPWAKPASTYFANMQHGTRPGLRLSMTQEAPFMHLSR